MDFVTTTIKISLKKLPVEGKRFLVEKSKPKTYKNYGSVKKCFLNEYFRYVYRFVCDLQELVGCSADQLHRMLDIQPDTDEK